jgi:hypothetical protein
MENNRVLGLFKFGLRDHVEQFVNEGLLYMNTLTYFKDLEEDEVRSDKHENADYCFQATAGSTLSVEQNGNWVKLGDICGPIISSNSNERNPNVFCMYAFRESAAKSLIDPRNFKFGDSCAVLVDGDEFLRRVKKYAEQNDIEFTYKLVKYVNRDEYNGPMGPFRKFSYFSYQSEFRIVVYKGSNSPLLLGVGSLSDISIIGPLSEVNNHIRVKTNDAAQPTLQLTGLRPAGKRPEK